MVLLSIPKLFEQFDPFTNPPWNELDGQTISREEVLAHIKSGELIKPPKYNSRKPETKEQHINRIAWYVVHGWGDSVITINLNWYPDWIVTDGCHRTCAAIIRNEEFICGNWEGPIDKARLFFYD